MTETTKNVGVLPTRNVRLLYMVVACLQTTFCGGVIFGWASISGTLLVASFENGGANLTLEETTSIFSTAAFVSAFSALILGFILDIKGPRICSIISHASVAFGFLIFSLATHYNHFLTGACWIAFGGPGILTSVVHIANLFPRQKFTAMALVTGCITLSFAVFPLFDFVWQRYGIGFRTLFQVYLSSVVLISGTLSIYLWPSTPYDVMDDDENDHDDEALRISERDTVVEIVANAHMLEAPLNSLLRPNTGGQLDRHDSFRHSKDAFVAGNYSSLNLKDQTFSRQVTSGVYLRSTIVFTFSLFFINLYVAALPTELADLDIYPLETQHDITRKFTLITSSGVVGCFFVGGTLDKIGLDASTLVSLLTAEIQVLILCFYPDNRIMMNVSFVIYTVFRSFLFPCYTAAISHRLGFKYFGILNGLGFAISGVAQYFIAHVVQIVQGTCHVDTQSDCSHGYWIELHQAQFFTQGVLMILPVIDFMLEYRRKKSVRNPNGLAESATLVSRKDYGSMTGLNEDEA